MTVFLARADYQYEVFGTREGALGFLETELRRFYEDPDFHFRGDAESALRELDETDMLTLYDFYSGQDYQFFLLEEDVQ